MFRKTNIVELFGDMVCYKLSLYSHPPITVFKITRHIHNVHVGSIGLCKGHTPKTYILYILLYYFHLQCCMCTKFQKL
jgi:hypothetical protein